MSDIKIDKGVPIPKPRLGSGGRPEKYPWMRMEVGDSFYVAAGGRTLDAAQAGVSGLAIGAAKRLGRKYTTRREGAGVRVWRIA